MTICYTLDPGRSRFSVQAFAQGILSMFAHNPVIAIRDFIGRVCCTPDTFADATMQMVVQARSLEVAGNVSPKDRREIDTTMHQEVLQSAAHPEIRFQSTEVAAEQVAVNWYRLWITGELFLRGVTNMHQLGAEARILKDGIRLSGEFTLQPSAYKIRPVTALGGMITLKDVLKFSFDLIGPQEVS